MKAALSAMRVIACAMDEAASARPPEEPKVTFKTGDKDQVSQAFLNETAS